jgi:hypothetical protein
METRQHSFSWIPRILSILIIIFISMFAADAFSSDEGFLRQLSDFIMHLLPSFLLLGILIIAWKRELTGGILYILLSLLASPFIYSMNYERNHDMLVSLGVILMITLPVLLAGVLFVVSYTKRKNLPHS